MLTILAKNRQLLRIPLLASYRCSFSTVDPIDPIISDNKVRIVAPSKDDEIVIGEGKEELTYSQEYYILNREEILQKRRVKEMEAKFGDFSARLVKRPKKDFLWGYGTQTYDENKENFFKHGCLPTIRELI